MRYANLLLLAAIGLFASSVAVQAHCEIPCGIYDDDMRFAMIEENIVTVEKSVKQIIELSKAERNALNANQLTRWINNKEQHADKIREIITQYFLTQKIKTPDEKDAKAYKAYTEQLVLAHKILRAAMVCKQTVDLKKVEALRDLAHQFQHAFSGGMKK